MKVRHGGAGEIHPLFRVACTQAKSDAPGISRVVRHKLHADPGNVRPGNEQPGLRLGRSNRNDFLSCREINAMRIAGIVDQFLRHSYCGMVTSQGNSCADHARQAIPPPDSRRKPRVSRRQKGDSLQMKCVAARSGKCSRTAFMLRLSQSRPLCGVPSELMINAHADWLRKSQRMFTGKQQRDDT